MNTKNLAGLLGVISVVAMVPAVSAADNFSRFYLQGGIGEKSINVDQTVSGGPNGSDTVKLGDNSLFGQVAGGYNLAVNENFRIGFGAFYDFGSAKAGYASGTIGALSGTFLVKERSHYGISFEPGYMFTKDSVAYVKITYNWMRAEQSISGVTSAYDATTFTTFGYGVGLKHMIGSKSYLYAEWQNVQYNVRPFNDGVGDSINYKPNESFGLLGVGVNF
jgi:hypothetical protein